MEQPGPDAELARQVDAALKALPPLPAPASLAPRVLAELRARAALPWWRRAWWDWPVAAKAAFIVLAVALAGALGGGSWMMSNEVTAYSRQVGEQIAPLTGSWEWLAPLGAAGSTLWRTVGLPVALGLAALGALAYLACLGLGTVFVRFALKHA
jgi:hypothetical protein